VINYNEKFTPQSKENLEKAEISLQTEPVERLSEVIQLKKTNREFSTAGGEVIYLLISYSKFN